MYRKPARVSRPERWCLLDPALLPPAARRATAPRVQGLVLDTRGHWAPCAPRSRRSLGAGAPDRLFREVHRDTFADGMAVFCNANGRREDSRMEGRVEEGVSQVGMGIKQLESRERERRGACHLWEEAPTWSPSLRPSPPIPTPPPANPLKPFPFSSECHSRCPGARGSCL